MALTVAEKMLATLREHGVDVPVGTELRRTYSPGPGAGTWCTRRPGGEELGIGSQTPMRHLVGQRGGFRVERIDDGQSEVIWDPDPAADC